MNVILSNSLYFVLPLVLVALLMKYVLKLNSNILLPSAIMALVFIALTISAPLTAKKPETDLFTLFCVLQLVALVSGIIVMAKQGVSWKHFFISLPFQLFYWAQLFYYGGLQFTHKF